MCQLKQQGCPHCHFSDCIEPDIFLIDAKTWHGCIWVWVHDCQRVHCCIRVTRSAECYGNEHTAAQGCVQAVIGLLLITTYSILYCQKSHKSQSRPATHSGHGRGCSMSTISQYETTYGHVRLIWEDTCFVLHWSAMLLHTENECMLLISTGTLCKSPQGPASALEVATSIYMMTISLAGNEIWNDVGRAKSWATVTGWQVGSLACIVVRQSASRNPHQLNLHVICLTSSQGTPSPPCHVNSRHLYSRNPDSQDLCITGLCPLYNPQPNQLRY